ncbi:MAG TPA: DNA-binding protein [Devosiaceae bacterium]|nr:DNA-binding protein [Devosiaceae bacterium]
MTKDKSQIEKFKEAARELETDDREEAFDRALKKVAESPKTSKGGDAKRAPKPHKSID